MGAPASPELRGRGGASAARRGGPAEEDAAVALPPWPAGSAGGESSGFCTGAKVKGSRCSFATPAP
eukprot:3698557-Pyramimonas_sp.AAC.1